MRKLIRFAVALSLLPGVACIVESSDDDDETDTETDGATASGPVTATTSESGTATSSPTSGSGETSGDTSGDTGDSSSGADETTSGPGEQVGSCSDEPLTQCLDYTGEGYVPEAFPMGCPNIFSEDPCPTEGVVFSCVFFLGDPLESIGRYYPPWSSAGAAQDCDQASGVPL